MRLKGQVIRNRSFREAIARGFGLIPEDRKKQGLVQIDSVSENICMSSLGKIMRHGVVRKKLEQQTQALRRTGKNCASAYACLQKMMSGWQSAIDTPIMHDWVSTCISWDNYETGKALGEYAVKYIQENLKE